MIRAVVLTAVMVSFATAGAGESPFRLQWDRNILNVSGETLPGDIVSIWYIEAYCRPGSTDRDWSETTIGHCTELISVSDDGQMLHLRCTLTDGVVVDHHIRAVADGVEFHLTAANRGTAPSLAHWAQPCVRVDRFTGADQQSYLAKSFVFLDGLPARLPTERWATKARYVPGQVWCPAHVSRDDVNPRPLSSDVPSSGLIGCFSKNNDWVLATAWEPYQELFQGVIVCLHSDFRIGGLAPGESKTIRGRLYLMAAPDGDLTGLLSAYRRDFPEHVR